MKKKKRKQRVRSETSPPLAQSHNPEWVENMHAHYQQTGLFRASDLNRVLGDPRKQVSSEMTDLLAMASHATHK